MRKNINKLATLVMTGALAASMSFSALAATGTASASELPLVGSLNTMTVNKKVTTDGKTYAPSGSFSFTVVPAKATTEDNKKETKEFAIEKKDGKTTALFDINEGIDKAVTATDATFAPSTVANEYNGNFTITVDESKFTGKAAGVYKYTLSEKKNFYKDKDGNEVNEAYPGMVYDANDYTMYVFVVNGEGTARKVSNIVIEKKNTDGTTAKVNELVNKYGNFTNTDDMHDLTISKVVAGNFGNHSESFTFNVSVKTDALGESFQVVKIENGKETVLSDALKDVNDGGAVLPLTISENVKYRVEGLTKGDEVTVKEAEAGKNSYVTTYAVTNGTDGADGKLVDDKDGAIVTVSADKATLVVTNTRDAVTPTGVVMDIAPYALMVALAGGAAATFLRKKESFED